MPVPDPDSIRRAVEHFQPRRRLRFVNLIPLRDDILALRDKGASCEAIADLLTQHGVRASRTLALTKIDPAVLTTRDPSG